MKSYFSDYCGKEEFLIDCLDKYMYISKRINSFSSFVWISIATSLILFLGWTGNSLLFRIGLRCQINYRTLNDSNKNWMIAYFSLYLFMLSVLSDSLIRKVPVISYLWSDLSLKWYHLITTRFITLALPMENLCSRSLKTADVPSVKTQSWDIEWIIYSHLTMIVDDDISTITLYCLSNLKTISSLI